VAAFRFSNRARADLDAIAAYTIETWNVTQAERYVAELEAASRRLAEIPQLGRRCDHIRPGLWRLEVISHVLFFRREGDDVLICRILHYRMLPEYQPIDDDEGERP
jgi:toxin ParE1/3/4